MIYSRACRARAVPESSVPRPCCMFIVFRAGSEPQWLGYGPLSNFRRLLLGLATARRSVYATTNRGGPEPPCRRPGTYSEARLNTARTRMTLGVVLTVSFKYTEILNPGVVHATYEARLAPGTWLLDDLHVVLTVLSSDLPIDDQSFGDFCEHIAYKYVASYLWHPMTVTLHKILIHGAEIIKSTTLPIGMLSEQASESRNKYWRSDREHHSRKMDRVTTMTDLFHRALESSDPIISSARLNKIRRKRHRMPLPAAAIKLLKPAAIPDSFESTEEAQTFVLEECLSL
ncbi:hypothetical protein ACJJTC_000496 [Scirpophaga incertulas]